MDALIRWSLNNRGPVLGIAVLLALAGLLVGRKLPVDVFPDLTAPTVTVIVEGRDISPEEMETLVTVPIEAAMNGAMSVRRVRSGTALGISVVWVEFDWDTDIVAARQVVNERLGLLQGQLPDNVRAPRLAPVSSIMGELMFISLSSSSHDAMAVRRAADALVRKRLLAIDGISQVSVMGGDIGQYQVVLSPIKLAALRLDAESVAKALRESNGNLAPGVLVDGPSEYVIEGIGRVETLADLESTVVCVDGGVPILVRDVGMVTLAPAPRRGQAFTGWRNSDQTVKIEESVILGIQKQSGADTLPLTKEVEASLKALESELPTGMRITQSLFRQASFVESAIRNTRGAIVEGAGMVVLVVLLFLASIRASLVTLVVLPLSLLASALVLFLLGDGINTMTLGGMAIAIGALVDDAIIDVENVVRRLRENRALAESQRSSTLSIVYSASVEVRSSVVLATLIILLVFAPLFFLDGVEGRLLVPLGEAFCVALASSMFVALTVTPVLCCLALPRSGTVQTGREPALVRALKAGYAPILDLVLAAPRKVFVTASLALAIAVFALLRCGSGFLPEFNEGALVVSVVTQPGTALEESNRLALLVDQALLRQPEVVSLGRRTGRADADEHVQGVEASEIDLVLDMQRPASLSLPVRTRAELLDAMRAELASVPGIQAEIGQPISHRIDHMLSGTRAAIAIKVFGSDLSGMRTLAQSIRDAIHDVPGVVDLAVEQQAMVPSMRVMYDREKLAFHGLRVEQAASALAAGTIGLPSGSVLSASQYTEIVTKTETLAVDPGTLLANITIADPAHGPVPLGQLAEIREDRVPNYISREDMQRKIAITCNVADRDVVGVVNEIQATIESRVKVPTGMRIEYGGQFESAQTTRTRLYVFGLIALLAIGILIYWHFQSWRDVLLVMVNLPFALIGGVAGVYISGGIVTVASIIGFITVFGVAARNGIMVISHAHHLVRHENVDGMHEAVRRAALERLAPVLMTALAAGLALVPLALRGDEPGTEILTPMAQVILFGLVSATLLNMLVLPSLYLAFGRLPATLPAGSSQILAVALMIAWVPACATVKPQPDWAKGQEELRQTTGASAFANPERGTDGGNLSSLEDGVTLEEAMRLALQRSPELLAGFHALGIAQVEYERAAAVQNPELGLSVLFPFDGARAKYGVDLLQPLQEIWQLPVRRDLAGAKVEEELARLSAVARGVLLETRSAWLELHAVQLESPFLAAQVALLKERADLVRAQVELGVQTTSAHAAAVRSLSEMEIRYDQHTADQRRKQEALALLLRVTADQVDVPMLPMVEDVLDSPPIDESATAIDARIDVRLARRAVSEAEYHLALAQKGNRVLQGVGFSAERPESDGATMLGPTARLQLPIFQGNTPIVIAAKQELLRRLALQQATEERAGVEIRAALLTWMSTRELPAQHNERVLQPAEDHVHRLEQALSERNATKLEVVDAELALLQAFSAHQELRMDRLRARLHLQEVSGAPLVPPAASN